MTGERVMVETIREAYGSAAPVERHVGSDTTVAVATAVTVAGAWGADLRVGAAAGVVASALLLIVRRADVAVAVVLVALGVAGGVRGEQGWAALVPDRLGAFTGWVTVESDPAPVRGSTRVIVAVEGERHEVWLRGRGATTRAREWHAGDRLLVSGERVGLDPSRARRVAWQHVVAELRIDWVADVAPGGPLARASNLVRDVVERGAASMSPADAALFRGLVIGDDRDQPDVMVERFRASGLSHLTAVSGQNVAFVLAAAGPVLRRLRPWGRLTATLALIGWFVVLTRAEPSVLRAGAMAALSAIAFATGRDRAPARLLGVSVIALILVDPLLTRSVGFWMSVGATAGVTVVAPWLQRQLAGSGGLAAPLAVTLGAQLGVAVPSAAVFGLPPVVSVPANLLAVPVAGAVMLVGLPVGLVAGIVAPRSPWTADVLMWPVEVAVRWVDTVAALGARLEPGGAWTVVGWTAVLGASAAVARSGRSMAGSGGHGGPPPHR